MASKKKRTEIPSALAAKVLFLLDRTCCVCRVKGKPIQIHHIDENPANNDFKNLAVLCFDCHTETQISGGFHRKIDAEQILLYKNDWLVRVAKNRTSNYDSLSTTELVADAVDLELATSLAEIYREREEYELLALHYIYLGNNELRDKYIELAIQQGIDDDGLIFFRNNQGRLDLVPSEVIQRHIAELEKQSDFFGLGRLYRILGDSKEAVKVTCKGIIRAIEKGRTFSSAFYLKEMVSKGDLESLFMTAFEEARSQNDLWWQYRALQELEWYSETREWLIKNRDEIEASDNPLLLEALVAALGDWERYIELRKNAARSEKIAKPKK